MMDDGDALGTRKKIFVMMAILLRGIYCPYVTKEAELGASRNKQTVGPSVCVLLSIGNISFPLCLSLCLLLLKPMLLPIILPQQ